MVTLRGNTSTVQHVCGRSLCGRNAHRASGRDEFEPYLRRRNDTILNPVRIAAVIHLPREEKKTSRPAARSRE